MFLAALQASFYVFSSHTPVNLSVPFQ